MKIVVCIKRTPDTETKIRLGQDGTSIDPSGVKFIISPYDEFAIEAGLQVKEASGEGEVVLLSLGREDTQETLRQGLAMGADGAVLFKGDPGPDGLSTAKALAAELKDHGRFPHSFRNEGCGHGPATGGPHGGHSSRPSLRHCRFRLRAGGGHSHLSEGGRGRNRDSGDGPPRRRHPHQGKVRAQVRFSEGNHGGEAEAPGGEGCGGGEARLVVKGLSYPPARPAGRVVGEGPDAVPELVRLLREEAKAL